MAGEFRNRSRRVSHNAMPEPGDRPLVGVIDGGNEPAAVYTVDELLDDTYDFIRRRLPRVDLTDPRRSQVSALLVALGDSLGRDRVVPARERQQRPR